MGDDTACCESLLRYRAELGIRDHGGWTELHQVEREGGRGGGGEGGRGEGGREGKGEGGEGGRTGSMWEEEGGMWTEREREREREGEKGGDCM